MIKFIIIFLLINFLTIETCFSYDKDFVHQEINKNVVSGSEKLKISIVELGYVDEEDSIMINREIFEWFRLGGKSEDEPNSRSVNHFHDPNMSWADAGLKHDWIGESSLSWAQNRNQGFSGTWSWPAARKYYLQALISPTKNVREENLAQTFLSLGQVLHLLADASVPEHVRNDIHVFPLLPQEDKKNPQIGSWTYETWCQFNMKQLNMAAPSIGTAITARSFVPGLAPISNFWDTSPSAGENPNPEGLAEYTNRNFLSTDTVFKDYPFPALAASDALPLWVDEATYNGSPDYRLYVSGVTTDGKIVDHLADTGYFRAELVKAAPTAVDDARYKLDDKCYQDYAAILVPKAVGYGTALLDYFFRGQMEITLPPQGIYALSQGLNGDGFSQIRLQARNTTPGVETMPAGKVTLVARYKVAQADPFQGVEVPVGTEFVYSVATLDTTMAIPRDKPVELAFTFATPIPLWATDLTLQLVYSGRLGVEGTTGFAGEEEAVVLGAINVSEPTPFDYINGMDIFCLNGAVVATGSAEALNAVDSNGYPLYWSRDVFSDKLSNLYLKFSTAAQPVWASPTSFEVKLPELLPGAYARVFYVANPRDLSTKVSHQVTPVPTDTRDGYQHKLSNYIFTVTGLANEGVVENGVVKRVTPTMDHIRGMKVWSSLLWTKRGYPSDTAGCLAAAAALPLAGPVPLTPAAP